MLSWIELGSVSHVTLLTHDIYLAVSSIGTTCYGYIHPDPPCILAATADIDGIVDKCGTIQRGHWFTPSKYDGTYTVHS